MSMRFPTLAATLRSIAAGGARAFYETIAADIVATLRARGSFLDIEDFVRHRGEVVAPIASTYRGLEVIELPPNGQGLVTLVLLNILEHFDLAAFDPGGPDRLHLALEAARLAFAVRDAHVADPSRMRVTVSALTDKGFAKGLAERIDRDRRAGGELPSGPTPAGDTTYVTVVDRDRMAVSIINSLYGEFGCRIATEKTGIMLHNRGTCFVLDPRHPNGFGPARRPMHTIIPALGCRDGRCDLSFGVMGANFQPMGHAHFITNLIDYGMDLQGAIDDPRVFFEGDFDPRRARHFSVGNRRIGTTRPLHRGAPAALGRRPGDRDRLAAGRAYRRFGSPQGRLRHRLLNGPQPREFSLPAISREVAGAENESRSACGRAAAAPPDR